MTSDPHCPALTELPGVRAQTGEIAAQLASGLNCLWLLPDHLVDTGHAEELYRAALNGAPDRLEVPAPAAAPAPDLLIHGAEAAQGWAAEDAEGPCAEDDYEAWDALPTLDFDDGFDIGWAESRPSRSVLAASREATVPEVFERIGKELAVSPDEVLARLTDPARRWRPVIGLRAWREPDDVSPSGHTVPENPARGGAVARLFRSLAAAVKEAGFPPHARPRLLVVARLRDVPVRLVEELERDIATTGVHWWWGTVGRLDTATAVASARGRDPVTTIAQRVQAAVREEVVTELAAFDLALAGRLAAAWDGRVSEIDVVLRSCLDLDRPVVVCPDATPEAGTRRRPAVRLRQAWSQGLVQSWEGRLRRHPALWYAEGGSEVPPELDLLVGQAQQRVIFPWVEDTRQRLARLGPRYATRPLDALVETYTVRPPTDYRAQPERAFGQLEVGALLSAYHGGGLALPGEELRLLKELVKARNILAHRGALRDATLHSLCEELANAYRRWAKL